MVHTVYGSAHAIMHTGLHPEKELKGIYKMQYGVLHIVTHVTILRVLWFSPTSKNWILVVNECASVCAWRLVMDYP